MFTLPASQVKIQTSFRLIPVGIIRKYELACRVFSSRQLHIDCAAVRRHADTHHHREFPVTVIPDVIRPAVVGGLALVFPVRCIDVAVIFKQIFARNGGFSLVRKFSEKTAEVPVQTLFNGVDAVQAAGTSTVLCACRPRTRTPCPQTLPGGKVSAARLQACSDNPASSFIWESGRPQ